MTKKSTAPALNLGIFGTAPATSKKGKTEYPVVPTTPEVVEAVDTFIDAHTRFGNAEGDLKAAKARMAELALEPFFEAMSGKTAIASLIVANGTDNNEAGVGFTKRYLEGEVEVVKGIVGKTIYAEYFYEKLSARINGDKLTDSVVKGKMMSADEKRQHLIEGLEKLFTEVDALDALRDSDGKFTVKTVVMPKEEFHTARHTILDVKKNIKLHAVMKMVLSHTVRGVNVTETEEEVALPAAKARV